MLQKIRDRATGPLAWFIVGIICIPFAFFGIEAFRSDGGGNDVAKVGGEPISEGQLQQQYQQRYQQLQQMLGENFSPDLINPDLLRRSVLDGLIQDAVNRQYLDDAGYRVSDEKLMGFIRAQDAFQENGEFSVSLYKDRLARQGMNPIQYEERVRAYLTDQQLRQAVTSSAVVTEAELRRAHARDKQQRRFAWRRYLAASVADEISISQAQIEQRFEERKDAFRAPERMRVSYLELDRNALKQAVEVDETALRELYEEEKNSRFAEPEQRQARHILIRSSEDDAEARIRELAEQLAQGAEFAALAKEHSQDPGSKNKGGDLGWVTRGMMVPAFEEALFALEPGAISAPVESDFGWHLILLEEIREARIRPFDTEETQRELKDMYRQRVARERFQAQAEQLEQLSFENPDALEPAAEALDLEVRQSEWFTRDGGAGIAAHEDVVAAAFSDLVLGAGENSQPISIGARLIVLRRLEHEDARPQTLDEVADDLRQELKAEAVAERLQQLAQAALARLENGELTLTELPETERAKNFEPRLVMRTDSQPNRAVVNAVFELEAPADGTASYSLLPLPGSQDMAIVALTEVIDGDWAEASEADKRSLRSRLLNQQSNQELAALQAALREQSKVTILRDSF